MNILFIALIMLPVGILLFLTNRKQSEKQVVSLPEGYEQSRNLALRVKPAHLKIAIPDDETLVYGLVMDLAGKEGFISLACYITGATNLFFSSGKKIMNGGLTPTVGETAVELITLSQQYLPNTILIATPIPTNQNKLQFHFLTNKGLFFCNESSAQLESNTSNLKNLFELGCKVIENMVLVSST